MKRPLLFLLCAPLLWAAPLEQATLTTVVNDVKITGDGAARKAQAKDRIAKHNGVKTGPQSRAELEFSDQTLMRLGANTVFSFQSGTRNITVEEGTMLFQVPKNAGGANLKTAGVTAAITGTTGLVQVNRASGKKKGIFRLALLEGSATVAGHKLSAGQIIAAFLDNKGRLINPQIAKVSVSQLLATSNLTGAGFGQLASQGLINKTIASQKNTAPLSLPNKGSTAWSRDVTRLRRETLRVDPPEPIVEPPPPPPPPPLKRRPPPPPPPIDPIDPDQPPYGNPGLGSPGLGGSPD